MPEFLKSHPMALHHCILYEFLQGKSAEWAFDDFCKTVGDDIIDKKEFQFWFNRFADGRYYEKEAKEPITDISSILRNDKYALRACVYYESKSEEMGEKPFLEKYNLLLYERNYHSVFGKYQKFCKIIGENSMDFLEFDYWFYRFLNGESIDLNSERDENKRIYELTDMPIYVVEKIMEHLDIVDRLSTRKVCRGLRAVVNEQRATFDKVSIKIDKKSCEIFFEHEKIEFFASKDSRRYLLKTARKTVSVEGRHLWKASEEFASVITHPKWKFKNVTIDFDYGPRFGHIDLWPVYIFDAFLCFHQIHVENLCIRASTVAPMSHILHRFHANSLHSLNFEHKTTSSFIEFVNPFIPNILEMDQWKQAKQLRLDGLISDEFPVEELFHAKNIIVSRIGLTEERLEKIRDILFKSPIFEFCSFGHSSDDTDLEDLTGAVDRVMGAHSAYDLRQKRYRIEGSADYFQISYRRDENRDPDDLFLEIRKIFA